MAVVLVDIRQKPATRHKRNDPIRKKAELVLVADDQLFVEHCVLAQASDIYRVLFGSSAHKSGAECRTSDTPLLEFLVGRQRKRSNECFGGMEHGAIRTRNESRKDET